MPPPAARSPTAAATRWRILPAEPSIRSNIEPTSGSGKLGQVGNVADHVNLFGLQRPYRPRRVACDRRGRH